MNLKKGFTIAEVLVVFNGAWSFSEDCIPLIIQSTQTVQQRTFFKKEYEEA